MHQLLQLLERQQRHVQARGAAPLTPAAATQRPEALRPETGGSHAGQNDPRLLDLQRALLYASAAQSQQTAGAGGAEASEPSKLVNAIQALLKVKQASSQMGASDPWGGSLASIGAGSVGGGSVAARVPEGHVARDQEGTWNSAQLHQLQRVLPQLTPATLSSLVGRLEGQKGAAFRDHVSWFSDAVESLLSKHIGYTGLHAATDRVIIYCSSCE